MRFLGAVFYFFIDLCLAFASLFFFSNHFSMLFYSFQNHVLTFYVTTFFFALLCVLVFRGAYALLEKNHEKTARCVETIFFFLFLIIGGIACYLTSRLSFFQMLYPKILAVVAVMAAGMLALFFPLKSILRRTLVFIAVLTIFSCGMAFYDRKFVTASDLVPVEAAGIKAIQTVPAESVLNSGSEIVKDLFGMLIADQQYLYLALDNRQDFLFANTFDVGTGEGTLSKIRLDDFQVVSRYTVAHAYFRDRAHLADRNQLVVAHWHAKKDDLYFLRASDLKYEATENLGFCQVQNVAELENGRILVTSELGSMVVLGPERHIVQRARFPVYPQEIALDRSKGILAIGSLAGYGLMTLDMKDLKVLKKRIVSFGSWGVALDPAGGRIFLTRTFLGDILVCDEENLRTIARIPLEPGLRMVCYLPERKMVVTGNYFNGKLYFIDGETYEQIGSIPVGSKIRSILYAPLRDRLYVNTALRILEIDPNVFAGGGGE